MRVKLFWMNEPTKLFLWAKGKGWFFRASPQSLEEAINSWLQQNPKVKVIDVKQSASVGSFAGSLWLISVWYEETA